VGGSKKHAARSSTRRIEKSQEGGNRDPVNARVLAIMPALTVLVACGAPSVTDIDRNTYPAVTIGDRVWLGANLRVTRAPDGTVLPTHAPNDDPSLAGRFGLLYDWAAAKRACMRGWHLPTDEDWARLDGAPGAGTAGALKDTVGWSVPNIGATNGSRFAARGAGYWNGGEFDNMFGRVAVYWSATPADTHFVWTRTMRSGDDSLRRVVQHPNYGFAVRCVRN
jgi:uncharacterized protein (TIGR02145 family)